MVVASCHFRGRTAEEDLFDAQVDNVDATIAVLLGGLPGRQGLRKAIAVCTSSTKKRRWGETGRRKDKR